MAYLKTEWLDDDKHAKALDVATWYTANSATIDAQIKSDAIGAGLIASEIAVDVGGNLTQPRLIVLGIEYALSELFKSNWGIRDSTADIYGAKYAEHKKDYMELKKFLTRSRVLYA